MGQDAEIRDYEWRAEIHRDLSGQHAAPWSVEDLPTLVEKTQQQTYDQRYQQTAAQVCRIEDNVEYVIDLPAERMQAAGLQQVLPRTRNSRCNQRRGIGVKRRFLISSSTTRLIRASAGQIWMVADMFVPRSPLVVASANS